MELGGIGIGIGFDKMEFTLCLMYFILVRRVVPIRRDGNISHLFISLSGGRRSPAVACWASDDWVASSNPLRGKFCH